MRKQQMQYLYIFLVLIGAMMLWSCAETTSSTSSSPVSFSPDVTHKAGSGGQTPTGNVAQGDDGGGGPAGIFTFDYEAYTGLLPRTHTEEMLTIPGQIATVLGYEVEVSGGSSGAINHILAMGLGQGSGIPATVDVDYVWTDLSGSTSNMVGSFSLTGGGSEVAFGYGSSSPGLYKLEIDTFYSNGSPYRDYFLYVEVVQDDE